jgi:hypothetical protein
MSSTLMWAPIPDGRALPYALKKALESMLDRAQTFDASNLEYLRGLRDGGVEGAQKLIDAIDKHETVRVWLEW